MKKTIKALKFLIVFVLITTSFIACDRDFNNITSDVLGKENSNFNALDSLLPVTAYNRTLKAIQINNLPSSLLGVFHDPAYGSTIASVVTQVSMTTTSPSFGNNAVIDSVVINIPYYSTVVNAEEDLTEYEIDSLYGNAEEPFKLSIYENGYFLRDFDPSGDFSTSQKYYSKADGATNNTDNFALNGSTEINFDTFKKELIAQVDDFEPDASEISILQGEGESAVVTKLPPALRIVLNTEEQIKYWKETILDKEGDAVLASNNNFKNYFRGLYIKAEAKGDDGNMFLLNFDASTANITINYTRDSSVAGERTAASFSMTFVSSSSTGLSNIRLNTFINNYDKATLVDGDALEGDERLYLKGTEGSIAVVELFDGLVDCDGDGQVNDDALDCFKKSFRKFDENGDPVKNKITGSFLLKRLINDAHLEIQEVEDDLPTGDFGNDYHKYDRIYAYDLQNNTELVDYLVDATGNSQSPLNSKIVSLGQRDTITGKFKIRLTEHLLNMLQKDSTNTTLGLVLSTNVNVTANSDLLIANDSVSAVPSASVISPRGTILYGTKGNTQDQALKLKVFYTEPD